MSGSSVSFVGAGTCIVHANQLGNSDYAAASQVTQAFTVGQASQSITFTSAAPVNATFAGPSYTVTATGGGSGNAVAFTAGSPAVCTVTGSTVSIVGAGSCVVDANETGNADYGAAPQATQSFTVAKASQAVAFTTTAPTAATFAGPIYTVDATGGGSGNAVAFTTGSPSVCTLSGSTVSFVGVGSCVVDADEAGSSDYFAAPKATQRFNVAKGPQAITFTSPAPTSARYGGPAYNVAAIGGASRNPVSFASGTSTVCTVAGSTVSFVGAGTCVLVASQAGDADFFAATKVIQKFTVGRASQSVAITSPAPTNATVRGPTYRMTATGGGSGNEVTFSSATPLVCTVAGSIVSFIRGGMCSLEASQVGNELYYAARPATQRFTVGRAARAHKPSPKAPAGDGMSAAAGRVPKPPGRTFSPRRCPSASGRRTAARRRVAKP